MDKENVIICCEADIVQRACLSAADRFHVKDETRGDLPSHLLSLQLLFSCLSLLHLQPNTAIRKPHGTLHSLTMPISAILRRVRQRFRTVRNHLVRRTDHTRPLSTANSIASPGDRDNEEEPLPQSERQRENEEWESYRSTPLIDRTPPSFRLSYLNEESACLFSFRRSPNEEILDLAQHIQDDGTRQDEAGPPPDPAILSITNPDTPSSPALRQSPAVSLRATAPPLSSPDYLLPFEQEESEEETARRREAALRMLEGEIPAVATGAYVRL